MKLLPAVTAVCLALLSGCQTSGIRQFWKTHSLDYSDIDKAEEQFALFAEQAVSSPEEDALAAMDCIFDLMLKDEVAYYIYSEWMDGAFYNILSPCRNAALYSKAVDRLVTDGIIGDDGCRPYLKKREWIQYNLAGKTATVPGITISSRTLVLVLDQSCPSCREALKSLSAKPELDDVRHVALCCGYGSAPDVPGWEFVTPDNASAVFDPQMTPIYFVVSSDGTVETQYQPAI